MGISLLFTLYGHGAAGVIIQCFYNRLEILIMVVGDLRGGFSGLGWQGWGWGSSILSLKNEGIGSSFIF